LSRNLASRTPQSTPESEARAGYDGAKRRRGAKVHAAVDTLGQLPATALPPMLLGAILGEHVVRRFDQLKFSRAVSIVILASGFALIPK